MKEMNIPTRLKLFIPSVDDLFHWEVAMKLIADGTITFTKKDSKILEDYLNTIESKEQQQVALKMIISFAVDDYLSRNRFKMAKEYGQTTLEENDCEQ